VRLLTQFLRSAMLLVEQRVSHLSERRMIDSAIMMSLLTIDNIDCVSQKFLFVVEIYMFFHIRIQTILEQALKKRRLKIKGYYHRTPHFLFIEELTSDVSVVLSNSF